jgi:hypothetical protein
MRAAAALHAVVAQFQGETGDAGAIATIMEQHPQHL